MRDTFGIAVAVMIALLSQIVEPWSGPWWTALITSAVIAIVVAIDIVAKQISKGVPMLPIIGMVVFAIGFIGFASWHFWPTNKLDLPNTARPLKRLIAYGRNDLIIPWNENAPQFQGYNVGVQNVSDDTITARMMFLNVDVDGTQVMASSVPSSPVIISQTQGTIFQARHTPPENHPIPLDAKTITTEFEVDYDTIPESGVRRSYRKIAYHLNWANGTNSAPLLEPQIGDEWEK